MNTIGSPNEVASMRDGTNAVIAHDGRPRHPSHCDRHLLTASSSAPGSANGKGHLAPFGTEDMTSLHIMPKQPSASRSTDRHSLGSNVESGDSSQRMAASFAALLDVIDIVAQERLPYAHDHAAVLNYVCQQGARLIPRTACAIYIKEPRQAGLHLVATSSPAFPFPSTWPAEFLKAAERGHVPAFSVEIAEAPVTARAMSGSRRAVVFWVPTPSPGAQCGLLALVPYRGCRLGDGDLALARRLAQVAGFVLQNQRLRGLAKGQLRSEGLMWEILDPAGEADLARALAQACRLGHNLLTPHVVIVAEAPTEAIAERLHRSILRSERSGLTDLLVKSVIAIVPVDQVANLLTEGLSVGVSRPCLRLDRYPSAYREAQEAVEIGTKLFGPGHITHFEDIESYRFIPTLIKAGLIDHDEYERIAALPDDLVTTLEVYLDSAGHAARAARQLFIHRNTLRQRLDRISTLLHVDLATSQQWLPLQLAVKAARLMRSVPTVRGDQVGGSAAEHRVRWDERRIDRTSASAGATR